jgi:hypothetical protein
VQWAGFSSSLTQKVSTNFVAAPSNWLSKGVGCQSATPSRTPSGPVCSGRFVRGGSGSTIVCYRFKEVVGVQRSRRRGRIAIYMGLLAVALVCFAGGAFPLWVQHSGVPARMTVASCGVSHYSHGRHIPLRPVCYGQPSGAPRQRSTVIWNTWWGDEGHDINAHMLGSGRHALVVKDSWVQPLISLGIGCIFGVGGVLGIMRRPRPSPT